MSGKTIDIWVNEGKRSIPNGANVEQVKDSVKPDADVLIVNGVPADNQEILKDGDRLVLFKRGEIPAAEEFQALLMARQFPGVYDKIKKATVGVAGLGGLGSAVSIALARTGVGTLILADYDVIEPSNLNRQQFTVDHIGSSKTETMKSVLAKINPYVQVKTFFEVLTADNVPDVFGSADVIVECLDRAEEKKMLLETAADRLPDVFIIGASGLAGYGDSNSIKTWRLSDKVFIVGDLEREASPGLGLMAPRVGIAAHHQANLAVSLLIDPVLALSQIPDIL